jgi:hypothetical protein
VLFTIFSQFSPHVKVFSYHRLYTGSDLIADIGGYLGLFLGLSVFGLVQIFENFVSDLDKRKEENDNVELDC